LYAVARRREGLFVRLGFIAGADGPPEAARVFARHHLQGAQEPLFREGLRGLDLPRPPGLLAATG